MVLSAAPFILFGYTYMIIERTIEDKKKGGVI
jgi:hypothetical protein